MFNSMFLPGLESETQMNPHPELRRPHLLIAGAFALIVTLACALPAPFEDPPVEKVAFDEVVGIWEGGILTIDFRQDGTFTLTSASYNDIQLEDKGTWRLCDEYPFEKYDEEGSIAYDCNVSEAGEWIDLARGEDRTIDFTHELIFTEDDELKLYAYNIDTGVDDETFYTKLK
ncbi:hypothetical protein [Glycomyces paridis]|uniref:Lipocalin-like domain-containing protein n=1 Tax=Glycomyces paridis TaxID=2126555 RepID=A0A4S8PMN0_9ACTN|nr:hypothetical protein [Glycomyces paridis]THV31391.1 hypothetical protein E9998_03225 [Glycomyces paridis]